jgi:hypothetical protein
LSVLIERVTADEANLGHATKEHLINIAEYILSWPGKYTKVEYDCAIAILAKYHLAHLASKRHGLKWVQIELDKKYKARCGRCGLPISSKVSLRIGYGHVCRKRLGISFSKDANKPAIKGNVSECGRKTE